MFNKQDVVIIGAGIIGCATAYYLTKAGLKVTVLEKKKLVTEVLRGMAAV